MSTPNSQARITELTELLAKATPGPWLYRAKSNSFHLPPEPGTTYSYGYSIMDDENCLRDADIDLVLAAVNALPGLLGKIAELEAALTASAEAPPAVEGWFVVAGWIDEQDAERLRNKGPGFVSCPTEVWPTEFPGVRRQTEEVRHVPVYLAARPQPAQGDGWLPIESAPRGGGAEYVTDPAWVGPPKLLVLCDDGTQSVAYWDWYYAEGGNGYTDGIAWVSNDAGEQLTRLHGTPTHWRPLPPPPAPADGGTK